MNTYEMIKIAAASFEIRNKINEGVGREELIKQGYDSGLVDGVIKLVEEEKGK